jgi:hypothetical protein
MPMQVPIALVDVSIFTVQVNSHRLCLLGSSGATILPGQESTFIHKVDMRLSGWVPIFLSWGGKVTMVSVVPCSSSTRHICYRTCNVQYDHFMSSFVKFDEGKLKLHKIF